MKAVRTSCRGRRPTRSGQYDAVARTIGWLIAGLVLGTILGGSCRRAAAAEPEQGVSSTRNEQRGTRNSLLDAVCRITAPDGARGTGCVFEISQGQVYVLTCGHVVEAAAAVGCEFWSEGHQSESLRGEVVAAVREPAGDAAIVAVAESQFGGRLPAAIPMAPRDFVVRPGDTLLSAGCANGGWSTQWKGHALKTEAEELRFVPPPANGRSGSAILDAQGHCIVGLLRARTLDNSQGIATSVQGLYRQLGQVHKESTGGAGGAQPATSHQPLATLTQCPGGNCPNGVCPNGQCPMNRSNNNFSLGIGIRNPYPTLPPVQAAPDLSPLTQSMGQIAQALDRLQPPPAAPTAPAGPDAATTAAMQQLGAGLQKHEAEIGRLREEIPRAVEAGVKPLSDKLSAIDAAVKPLERIKERLDEDVQAGGLKGKLAQKIEELAAGKPAESGDPNMRIVLITLAAAVGVGLVVFLVIRQHQSASSQAGLLSAVQTAVSGAGSAIPALAPAAAGLNAAGTLIQNQLAQLQQGLAAQAQALQQVALATPAPSTGTPTATPAPSASVQIATPASGAGPQTAAAPAGAH